MKTTHTLHLLLCCFLLISSNLINAQCHIDDWTALKALYEATDGDNWKRKSGWETIKNSEPALNCDLKKLQGLTLNATGRVQEIKLPVNLMGGNIPPEIGKLSSLEKANLYGNNLLSIPPELGSLNNLEELQLDNNNLTSIPPEIGNLSKLKFLTLHSNRFRGGILPELGNLSNLNYLRLTNNQFSGNIPAELGNLKNLSVLYINDNQLSGNIPTEFGEISNLVSLDLGNNQLDGNIPHELGNLSNLNYLDLSNNRFSGSIPSELGNLDSLSLLNLNDNELNGNIPAELGNLANLERLYLNNNQLTGNIPDTFSNLSLYIFNVSNNQLSGNIPYMNIVIKEFSTFLYEFYFQNNYFICSDFGNFTSEALSIGEPFYYAPQYYIHNAENTFLIESSEESVLLSAPFNITDNFTYQWYKNWQQIEGATDTILQLYNIELNDVGEYTLRIYDDECPNNFREEVFSYISDPISVRRTDLEGCTDINSCNYNEFAFIDDGSCEYIWCDTMTNPIRIRTDNETILSETQIKFDIVIDSLDLDYSADGLTFTLDTRGNYRIESIEVINPNLSKAEVDISQLYNSTISINRINKQRLASNEPIISVTGCIVVDEIPTDESSCSYFAISGGTKLASGHFIDFDNIYIDIPFSNCSPYGDFGAEGENWLPMVLNISPQNCQTETAGLIEIKILQEGLSPFAYILKNEEGAVVLEATSEEKRIDITELNAGNYELTVFDMEGKKTTLNTCIPLVANLNGNVTCQNNCIDYVVVPDGEISGIYKAKKEIEIKGFVSKTETVEFNICD